MKLRWLKLDNFRSFRRRTKIVLDRRGVFVYLSGWNKRNAKLGANGVGKSSIWDALLWCFSGTTANGLRAGALCSWESKNTYSVKARFYIHDGWHTLFRSWHPNSLNLDGEEITQDRLNEFFGFDLAALKHVMMMPQGEESFFDMSASEKLALFTKVMRLDKWLEYSDDAKEKVAGYEERIGRANNGLSFLKGKISGIDIEALEQKANEFDARIKKETESLREAEFTAKKNLAEASKVLATHREELTALEARKTVLDEKLFLAVKERTKREKELRAAETSAAISNDAYDRALKKFKSVVGLKANTKCTACGQLLRKKHIVNHANTLRIEAHRAKLIQRRENKLCRHEQQVCERAAERESLYADKNRGADKNIAACKSSVADARAAVQDVTRTFERIKEQLAEKEKQENTSAELLAQAHKNLRALRRGLRKQKSDINKLERRVSTTGYWVSGFKMVRLYLVEQLLKHLELETNSQLFALGLQGWKVEYRIAKENKSGNLVQGFDVLITSPHNKEQVPFEAWSGGEKQRLRIAGQMAFMDVVNARSGFNCNIEVYDEPTTHLSSDGVNSLLNVLKNRAQEKCKTIWMSDHHTLESGMYDESVTVVADKNGSRIE